MTRHWINFSIFISTSPISLTSTSVVQEWCAQLHMTDVKIFLAYVKPLMKQAEFRNIRITHVQTDILDMIMNFLEKTQVFKLWLDLRMSENVNLWVLLYLIKIILKCMWSDIYLNLFQSRKRHQFCEGAQSNNYAYPFALLIKRLNSERLSKKNKMSSDSIQFLLELAECIKIIFVNVHHKSNLSPEPNVASVVKDMLSGKCVKLFFKDHYRNVSITLGDVETLLQVIKFSNCLLNCYLLWGGNG